MKILIFKAVPIIVGILLSCAQACKSTHPKGWYVKVRKAEYEAKVKELEAAKAKEKELSSKLLEEREQNPVPSIIEEEEKVLEMMEDQELPRIIYQKVPVTHREKDCLLRGFHKA